MTATCGFCRQPFTPKPGKRFCRPAHKDAYHSALRRYATDMIEQGYTTREIVVARAGGEPCTAAACALDMRALLEQPRQHTRPGGA